MDTTSKFAFCFLLVTLLVTLSGVCHARSTFSAQELQELWPFLHGGQLSSYVPVTGEEHVLIPTSSRDNEEPSSRDLDIGFTVGDNNEIDDSTDDVDKTVTMRKNFILAPSLGYRDRNKDDNDFSIDVFADPQKSRRPVFGVQREPTLQQEQPWRWPEGWVPRHSDQNLKSWVPVQLTDRLAGAESYPQDERMVDLQNLPILQDEDRTWTPRYWVPTSLNERSTAKRMMQEKRAYPAVISQPLVNKVGTMRLTSDRGHQLAMHVPPMSRGDRPGVLELNMKATLYRPIYY